MRKSSRSTRMRSIGEPTPCPEARRGGTPIAMEWQGKPLSDKRLRGIRSRSRTFLRASPAFNGRGFSGFDQSGDGRSARSSGCRVSGSFQRRGCRVA